jgi:hypothetical protein
MDGSLSKIYVLVVSFCIGAFAGLAAYLRGVSNEKQPLSLVGIATALSNGGAIGIATCGFCYWKCDDKPDYLWVFAASAVVGLGGLEMVNLVLELVKGRMNARGSTSRTDESNKT